MGEPNLAWVPPAGDVPQREPRAALVLAALREAYLARARGEGTAERLQLQIAGRLIAADAIETVAQMQASGELPRPDSADWARLMELARSGDVDMGFLVVVRGGLDPAPEPGRPGSLAEEIASWSRPQ